MICEGHQAWVSSSCQLIMLVTIEIFFLIISLNHFCFNNNQPLQNNTPMIFNESKSIIVDSQSDVAEKRTDSINGHRSLFSKKNFKTGEVIATFYWDQIFPTPTYLTVQISEHEHIL